MSVKNIGSGALISAPTRPMTMAGNLEIALP